MGDSVGGSRIRGRVGRLRGVVGGMVGWRKIVKIGKRRRKGIELGRIYRVPMKEAST